MFFLSIQQMNLNWFQFFTVLSFLLFLLFLYKHLLTKSSSTKQFPPNPPKLPLLGNIHQLGRYPHRSLQSLSKRYGEVMFIYLGRRPTLIISSDKAAREIMKTQDAIFSNRPSTKTGDKLLYNGKDVAAAQYGRGGTEFGKLLREFMEMLGTFRVGDFIPSLSWTNRLDGWDAKVDRVAKELDEFLEQVVKEHEDRPSDEEEDKGDSEKVKDFVDVLLDDMFSGGTDTTYTVLEWAMTELIRHPKIMHELQKEVREITGTKSEVTEDDLNQMKYLKAVIKETLRLHPPIPLLVPRLSLVDAKLNGYDIPAGTAVITNAWAIQRDPATWEEPETFNPERFLNSPTDFKGQDFELIPFGSGRRICPGILFAISNNELVLANLMHRFDWTLPGGANSNTLDTSECKGLTIHRKTPLLVVATSVVTAAMAEPEIE
ncbi:hypothetical protein KSS87_007779 [Heliosperma pusillum]|nr:hypothetical protein KSS87_007779 [Heliosperma pusillum]